MPAPAPTPGAAFPRRLTTARGSPRRVTAIGAGCALAVGAVVVAELVARDKVPSQPLLLVDDATCFYTAAADTRADQEKPGTSLHHRFAADARGYRVPVGGAAAPAATEARCRVLCVGDSFTEGLWVDAEQAYPSALERAVGERGYSVRIDNGGMRGHTIAQERMAALGRFREPRAQIVIVGQTANDLEDLVDMSALGCRLGGPPPAELHRAIPPGAEGLGAKTQDLAAGITLLGDRLRGLMSRSGGDVGRTEAACAAAAKDYEAEAAELAREVRQGGGHALFAALEPAFCAGRAWRDPGGNEAFYASTVREAGGIVEDVDVFRAPGMTLAPLDGHPSPEGHRRAAARLADRLVALGWLTECRAGAAPK